MPAETLSAGRRPASLPAHRQPGNRRKDQSVATQTQSAPREADDPELRDRIRTTVERSLRRGLVGLEYITIEDTDVGKTPKDTVLVSDDGAHKLYHYRAQTDEIYRVPLLFVTSLVSKPYILDLTPGQSLIEYLVRQGYDVYLIDWGIPRARDSHLRLEDYALDFLPKCVETVLERSGEDEVTIAGYCLGGTLALCYAAARPEAPIKNLACITTPVNFHGMGLFSKWTDRRYFDVDRVVDTLGNVPGELLLSAFDGLRPAGRVTSTLQAWDRLQESEYVRTFLLFDRWAADQIPFAGETFRQLTKELMWDNKLLDGTLELAGQRIDIRSLNMPVFHAMAEHDHIVPYEASKHLTSMLASEDKEEVVLRGGHVSLVAGGNALYRLWPKLDQWLSTRSV